MKTSWTTLCSLLLAAFVCASFVACSDDEDEVITPTPPVEEPEADYTVMLYGVGGGNLDDMLVFNLEQVDAYGYTSNVNFTGLIKYSAEYQDDPDMSGTRLLNMTEEGLEEEVVYPASYRMDNPDHLADFIKDAKERMPAKRYILVLWNHGIYFGLNDQPYDASDYDESIDTKGILFDDNCEEKHGNDAVMSIFELEEGLKRSETKFDVVYMDACMMNMLEYLYQIKDYTNYVLAASHITPGVGGNYSLLFEALEKNDDLEEAMRAYIWNNTDYWRNTVDSGDISLDMMLSDMNKIDNVVNHFKSIADYLSELNESLEPGSQEELLLDYYISNLSYKYSLYYQQEDEDCTSVDAIGFFSALSGSEIADGYLSSAAALFSTALDDMTVTKDAIGVPTGWSGFSIGVTVTDDEDYNWDYGDKIDGLNVIYPLTAFDKATGWSRFLSKNVVKNFDMVEDEDGDYYLVEVEDTDEESSQQ